MAELTLASNKSVALEYTRSGTRPLGGLKKVSRGESVTLGIGYMQDMLAVVHSKDTLWMEEKKPGK